MAKEIKEIIQKLKECTRFGHTNSVRNEYFTPVIIKKSQENGKLILGCYRSITEHNFYEEYNLEAVVQSFLNGNSYFLKR